MKTKATKDQATTGLVPKLRFPEFRGTDWIPKKLEDVAPLQRGFDLPSDLIRPGDIPVVYSNGIQKYHEIGMATAPGLVTGRSGTIGKLHFIEHGEYWPHNTSLWVTDFKGNEPRFVYYLYDSIGMGRFSSGSGVPTLNRNDVHAFGAPIPSSTAEQQKIADCLGSLDELIAAQGRMVDALKTHKRGLMQQLFPREGETQPRLRFPEFQNAEAWEPTTLGGVGRLRNGYAFKSAEYVDDGPYRIVTIANVQQGNLTIESTKRMAALPPDIQDHQVLSPEDILISMTGNVGRVCRVTAKGLLLNQRVGKLAPEKIDAAFFYHLLQREEFRNAMQLKAAGGAQGNLSAGDITEYAFFKPTSTVEQQRIADCLTALDTLITAATQVLDTLKTHKQGLMQQLFPSAEALDA